LNQNTLIPLTASTLAGNFWLNMQYDPSEKSFFVLKLCAVANPVFISSNNGNGPNYNLNVLQSVRFNHTDANSVTFKFESSDSLSRATFRCLCGSSNLASRSMMFSEITTNQGVTLFEANFTSKGCCIEVV
jgi:hypothetical protein